ncbi:MAG: group 1 truncated hemoglobin [Acidimicrobiales bacterium]|nr:group 1 truncated hemoglobin [Acidimicrobiales bacterium]
MSDSDQSLYDRIGGEATIDRVVDDFYGRVLSDPVLGSYFHDARMERLRRMQKELFTQALGGAPHYSGMDLTDAHRGRGISPAEVSRFTEHLLETLEEVGLAREDIDEVLHHIALLSDDVVGGTADAE